MHRLPPLSAVRAFEAAARHLNYTRAGEELGLTQAGVSYQIRALEERLGEILFVRNGRKMELTPAGMTLAPRITDAFATMDGAFTALQRAEDSVLAIACFETFATKVLAPRLGDFQIAHPEFAVRLVVSDEFVDLEAGSCDVAIRLSQSVPSSLSSHDLMPLTIAPFSSPDVAERVESGPNSLAIPVDERISPTTPWWRDWDEAVEPSQSQGLQNPSVRALEFGSQMLDAAAAITGNGVAILATALFHHEVQEGKLVRVGTRVARPGRMFRLIYPELRRNAPKIRAFRRWFAKEIEPLNEV